MRITVWSRGPRIEDKVEKQEASTLDFAEIAGRYDCWYNTTRGAMYDRLEKQAFDQLLTNRNNGKRMIEVGCGTGHWSRYFSDRGLEVTAVDISKEMIDIARQKHITHCRFLVADGASLPFADNGFDVAAAITTLEFAAKPKSLIAEMARCVRRPGGRLLFGLLNALSPYNWQQNKNESNRSVRARANLFSPRQAKELLDPFGRVKMLIVGFVPSSDRLILLAPLGEFLCRLAGSQKGAFIVGEVQL